ncbi:ATPases involved in chromosome partitioning [Caballeronia glathei]|nr:hypothetical protein [Caballeronia glathei]CDY73890.1 ATPases involved in chromosome partitioning [Caballeronia glathei]
MRQLVVNGSVGEMSLLTQHEIESGRLCRSLSLRASHDGKSVLLIEMDERKAGIQREFLHDITTGELIALIRAHGAELTGEGHVSKAHSD